MSKFETVRVLGKGGFGRAILVKSESDGQHKVLKEINISEMPQSMKGAVQNEINALKVLNHSNIIRYENHYIKNKKAYILMEYANAGDLSALIASRKGVKWSEETIVDWFVQMCLAVKFIHDRKIIHRDIKPGNFFLTSQGIVKLGDFGLAAFLPYTTALLETSIGTPYYLAPEVCLGKPYNQKSDIWSLGCVLCEMCTLKKPFDGHSVRDVMISIQLKKPPRLPTFYSNELKSLVASLLNKDASRRPSINDIMWIPFIRFKAMALLGRMQLRSELSHTIFHGYRPGETPDSAPDKIVLCNETPEDDLPDDDKIIFMGRTLRLPPCQSLAMKAETLRAFLEDALGVSRFTELYRIVEGNESEKPLSKTETWAVQLIMRLIACEEAASNNSNPVV